MFGICLTVAAEQVDMLIIRRKAMNKTVLIIIGAIVITLGAYFLFYEKNSTPNNSVSSTSSLSGMHDSIRSFVGH
jgi:hypothetical protein